MSTETAETWLDEDAWTASRDELIQWLRQRGWSDTRGALEYPPSRPPQLIKVQSPMAEPSKPTTIDIDTLGVYPPRVEFALDGTEDPDDDSPTSWKRAETPSELEVTGGPVLPLSADVVTSTLIGEEDPRKVRDMIDTIEGWRWPLNLPSRHEPWVEFWEPGYPAGVEDAEAVLAARGWHRSVHLVEGDVLSRGTICWSRTEPGALYRTAITVGSHHLGYKVALPRADATNLLYTSTDALVGALDIIERWTPGEIPRWAVAPFVVLREATCPECGQPAGTPCASELQPFMGAVHASRVPERLTAIHVPAAKPRPGQRPANGRRSKNR